jgi:hypothetical protein
LNFNLDKLDDDGEAERRSWQGSRWRMGRCQRGQSLGQGKHTAARAYINMTRVRRQQQENAGYSMVTGSESELFVAMLTGAAVMAAATVGFYTHEAVKRLLLRQDAGNARVEGRLSKMEQLMQQQQEKERYVLNRMNVALDLSHLTNKKLE